ncbi:MAG: UvrD-helicase domain-containing protein, partial [Acidobacteria bacterium]|nr:UvrD-helicase domain-containing protein [Acidobacteriota bacterium]
MSAKPPEAPSALARTAVTLSPEAELTLGGLNEEQHLAVTDPHTPLAIIASAGAGKTRVLTRRVAYQAEIGAIEPDHTLVLTFTRKAAGELRGRLRDLGLRTPIAAGTFHAVAYAQLRRRWEDHDVKPPDLLDRKVGFVARLLGRNESITPLDIVTEIEWSKARMIHPDAYIEALETHRRRAPGGNPERIAEFYDTYERSKRKAKLVDFDDLLAICRRHMLDDAE